MIHFYQDKTVGILHFYQDKSAYYIIFIKMRFAFSFKSVIFKIINK